LAKPDTVDIDIAIDGTSPYDTLKQLVDVFARSGTCTSRTRRVACLIRAVSRLDLCSEVRLNTEHKPTCLELIVDESNLRVRITSDYARAVLLSQLIDVYTKFDERVIRLLRLCRVLVKVRRRIDIAPERQRTRSLLIVSLSD
jgi:hypothetical protein